MSTDRIIRKIAKARIGLRIIRRGNPNMLTFVLYGLLYDVAMNLYKPFGTKFLERLGGGEGYITLYNALPGVFAIFAIIPGAMWISRLADKQRATAAFLLASRAFLLVAAFVPFLPVGVRPMVFVMLIAAMNFPDAISQSAFQGCLGSALADDVRAKAISWRSSAGNVMIPVVTLATGLIIAFFPKTNAQRIVAYQLFFVAAFSVGLIEIRTFLKFKIPKSEPGETEDRPRVADALRDKRFTRFLICTLIFYLTWQAGWPLGNMITIMILRANEMWLALNAVASGVSAVICAVLWNQRIRRMGNSRVLVEAAGVLAVNALLMAIAPSNSAMVAISLVGGCGSVGMTMALLNGLLQATPDKHRIVYIGVYNTCVSLSLATSAFLAHGLFTLIGARGAIGIVAVCRALAAITMGVMLLRRPKNLGAPPQTPQGDQSP